MGPPVPALPPKPPVKPLPPAPKPMVSAQAPIGTSSGKKFSLAAPSKRTASRIGIYGTGGIGKTTLACRGPGPVYVIDLDNSLGVLAPQLTGANVKIVGGIESWSDLREVLHQEEIWKDCNTVVIDTLSRAEELCIKHMIDSRPTDKGQKVNSIEGYGYGKGYQYLYEEFLLIFADLDAHIRAGRNVVTICHDIVSKVPNPAGEDFKRYEPRLQSPDSGKSSVRHKYKEWNDHLLFVAYDIVAEDKKARGNGTRTIWPQEQPWAMAKSRLLREPILYQENDSALWQALNK